MGLKSFARKVRGGTSSLPSNPEAERQQELARIDKEQARADKAQKKANGNKVLPVSASEEQEHRELSARIYAVERDMQEQRREVMKPRPVGDQQTIESRHTLSSFQRQPIYIPDSHASAIAAPSTT